jgi:hypothetical protein
MAHGRNQINCMQQIMLTHKYVSIVLKWQNEQQRRAQAMQHMHPTTHSACDGKHAMLLPPAAKAITITLPLFKCSTNQCGV